MNLKWVLGCGLPLLIVIGLGVWGAQTALKPKPKVERSEVVQSGDVEIKVVETGSIEPLRKVEVKSKAGGRISHLYVDAGATVQQGQVIATIDPQEINSQVEALRAQLAGAQARLEAARKTATYQQAQTSTGIDQYVHSLAAAEARMREAEAEAKAQPKLTGQSIDAAQSSLDSAKSQAQALQDTLNLMVNSTHPQAVVTAQSAYDTAKAQENNSAANVRRQKTLLGKGFVSQQVVDTAQTDYDVAQAHTREVKDHLDRIKQTNALEEENMKSQIAGARSQVKQAQAMLDQAKTNITPETKIRDLESARAAYQQAKSQLAAARAGKTQDLMRMDEVASSAAEVRQIQNQLNQLLVQQHDTTITASMPGMITKRYVEQGELITSAIGSFSQGTAIFQLADLATMLVKINVNEVDISKVKVGLPAEVTIDAAKGVTFIGHVHKVSPSSQDTGTTGTSSGSTQSVIRFPVEVQLDKADPRLKPGMSARCSIICARRKNVVRIPTNCVQGEGAKGTVQLVTTTMKDGKPVETAAPQPVTVGLRGDDFVEVVDGLKPGQKVRPNPYSGPPRPKLELKAGAD